MSYTLDKITSLIGAHRYGQNDADIDWLLTDSRSLAFPEATLFFAIHTQRNNGHKYIPDLYRRGVRNFVVNEVPADWNERYPEANFLWVVNTLKALQRLSERHREEYNVPVIGVTGSNGKTIVKEWLYQLLSPSKIVTRSPRSYNSQVGVPLSVWLLNEQTELAIFEAGISQPDEMQALRAIIQPTIGILTNIGTAHQENFTTLQEKCLEKLSLFKDCNVLIYNGDDPIITECVQQSMFPENQIAWSLKNMDKPMFIKSVKSDNGQSIISYQYLGYDGEATIPFIDEASIENAIHCLAVCLFLHIPQKEIAKRMAGLEPVAMRLEVKEGCRNCTLINDSYNSDVNSLDIALDFMNRRADHKERSHTLILSDIFQSGMNREQLYTKVAQLVNSRGIDKIIGVGPDLSAMADLFTMEKYFFHNTEDLMQSELLPLLRNEEILLKGSRLFHFDRLSEILELKVHETILEVNLGAIVDNLNYYRSFMQATTKMVCMVKASGYGAGSIEIAKTLQDHQVDYLAVAVADEGADLRKAGITSNIIIMNPEMTAFKEMFDYELEPEVYNFHLLEALIKAAEKEGITHYPVHIKLDTGMHRLGFNPDTDMPALVDRLKHQTAVIPRSVFSHFVGSDSDDFDRFSAKQFAVFDKASLELQASFRHKILRHICNSAGIEHFPQRHLDMVRLGLGLYGINPRNNTMIHTTTTLKTTILQLRNVVKEDTVGYSRKGLLTRDSIIAALPIGYADGLNRHLGNGNAYCLVNGQKAYYVGNICMDVCMIDVTDIPCKEGDTVIIFGNELPVTILSDLLQTIPYEILTSVSNRVKRVYYQD
ncbi:MAG: bifunctional UDP-N-acetylmuramoyl-tripeptide:D-alanyl-D-alanine ligase/alanine racemase [Bacteroidaceae bacterium]